MLQSDWLLETATTPITRADWLASSILYQLILSVISTAAILLVSYFVFDVRLHIGFWLPLIVVVEVVAFTGIGMLLTPFAKEAESASAVANAFLFPMMFLSGTFFPVEMMPTYLQTFAKLLPLYYVNEALRSAMKRAVCSSTSPAPASCVSRTCDSMLSSLPSTPTMPPCAQAVEPPVRLPLASTSTVT